MASRTRNGYLNKLNKGMQHNGPNEDWPQCQLLLYSIMLALLDLIRIQAIVIFVSNFQIKPITALYIYMI